MWREFIQALDPASTFFSGATVDQLTMLEATVHIELSEELKSVLMESNGVPGAYGL